MSDTPGMPPPPPPMMPSKGNPSAKVTAAGVILLVLAGLVLLATLYLLTVLDDADLGGTGTLLIGLSFVEGALNLVAGVLVLKRKNAGRIMGIALCALGLAVTLAQIASLSPLAIIGIALRVIVIVMLAQTSSEFS